MIFATYANKTLEVTTTKLKLVVYKCGPMMYQLGNLLCSKCYQKGVLDTNNLNAGTLDENNPKFKNNFQRSKL